LSYLTALRITMVMGRAGLSLNPRIQQLLRTLLPVETSMLSSGGEARFRQGVDWDSLALLGLRVPTLR
jgi:hypothetical protein